MIVYHGTCEVVREPDILHSFRSLDFGKAFYVTENPEQAERWARRKALLNKSEHAIVNQYQMEEDLSSLKVKIFADDLNEWIDFVCDCRDGKPVYQEYDLIIGKVANDRVFRVVDMYHQGIWDRERALIEIRAYPDYDQTAFVTQKAIDRLLRFDGYREVAVHG